MKDDVGGISIFAMALVIFIFSVIGSSHLVIDFRDFKEITDDCKKRGYIQNNKTRINCTVISE